MNREQAIAAAEQIATVAAEHADESEQLRRLAPPVAVAIRESGLGGLIAPTVLGGDAAHPALMAEVVEIVGRKDASAAWCLGIGSGTNHLAGLVSKTAATELFTDLNWPGVGPFEPLGRAVKEGDMFRVNGRWRYSSNCHQGGVLVSGVFLFDGDQFLETAPDGTPIPKFAYFSRDQYEIEESWNTVGMRGTGSHDTIVTDVLISPDRIAMIFDDCWPDDPLFRLRPVEVLGACLSAVPLGVGRAALDIVAARAAGELAEGGPQRGPRNRFPDDAISQAEYARADVRLRAARALLHDALDQAYQYGLKGDKPPREITALLGLAHGEAASAGADAVDSAARIIGSASIREGAPLERMRRDMDTARQHVMFSRTHAAPLGRQLAGLPTVHAPYLGPLDR
jgi:alkylation response protein AidB-like acyl-CoA dehydrogenase